MEYVDQYQQALDLKYECFLFDLDDTLYPLSSGLSKECTRNIQEYMIQKLGMEQNRIPDINRVLYKNYGTTMAGLRAFGYDFDYDDYHSFVHGRLPYEILKPDHVLRSLLLSLPIRKVIFTNADKVHAVRTLSRLGLEGCFERIICFETLNPNIKSSISTRLSYEILDFVENPCEPADAGNSGLPMTPIVCKPFEYAFEQAFKIANINPQRTMFFDDSIRNIQNGKRMGLHTVLVGNSHRPNGADYALESIHNIKEALPELWEASKNPESRSHSGKVAMETSVIA